MTSFSATGDSTREFKESVDASGRFRSDIQALRGYAIFLVLLHHANFIHFLKAGYLGVDVFFVVSGFLITGIVQRNLLAGTFSFKSFYLRRAKRLLPAAYVVFLSTILLSFLFLTRAEMDDFVWQVIGAITFTGNISLWTQTGYFENVAHLKPLLHVWSLSLEEQYYLLLPAALVFLPRRYWNISILLLVVLSLVSCLVLVTTEPGTAFYWLPTRAWELALGSFGTLALIKFQNGRWVKITFWPAIFFMCYLPLFPTGAPHPGLDALIICSATLVVILRQHAIFELKWVMPGLVWLGDISYSLYLVHWPLLAFAANAWISPVPGVVRLVLAIAAIFIGWAIYYYIEKPIRAIEVVYSRTLILKLALTSAALVLLVIFIKFASGCDNKVDFRKMQEPNVGLNEACEYGEKFQVKLECITSSAPKIMIWGDSYAMHVVDGIRASTDHGLVQATKTTCGPFVGISMFSPADNFNHKWAEGCISFNQSVLDYISITPSIDVVVISSLYDQYLSGHKLLVKSNAATGEGSVSEIAGSESIALNSLAETIDSLRAMHKRVVLIAPPPSSSFDTNRCLELRATGKFYFGADYATCEISEENYRRARQPVLKFLEAASRDLDVSVIYLDTFLCHDGKCSVEKDGVYLYRDGGHLSHAGSHKLGAEIQLADRLLEAAR